MQVCHTPSPVFDRMSYDRRTSCSTMKILAHKGTFYRQSRPYPPPASLYVRRHYFQIDNTLSLSPRRFTYLLQHLSVGRNGFPPGIPVRARCDLLSVLNTHNQAFHSFSYSSIFPTIISVTVCF